MNYALVNYRGCTRYQNSNIIIVKFQYNDAALPSFIEKWGKEKMIWIDLSDVTIEEAKRSIQLVINIYQKYKDEYLLGVMLGGAASKYCILEVLSAKMPYMLTDTVTDWDTLTHLIAIGAHGVYIGGALGFELDKVSEILHKFGMWVWVKPNLAQSSVSTTPGYKKFWIRPEDVEIYESYVDVMQMEFPENEPEKQLPYLRTYQGGVLNGTLNDFIIDLNITDVPMVSYKLPQELFKHRISCGKRCLKGSHCKACEGLIRIARKEHELESNKS